MATLGTPPVCLGISLLTVDIFHANHGVVYKGLGSLSNTSHALYIESLKY
jgi:hypothetical protein